MSRYIIERIISTIPLLVVISFLAFFILHLVPGDPILALLGPGAPLSEEAYETLVKKYNFDKSILTQYLLWGKKLLKGDLGWSFSMTMSVGELIKGRLPATLILTIVSFLLATLISVPLGFIAAVKQHTWIDQGVMLFALLGLSIPNFVIGVLFILCFSVYLRIFPVIGYVSFLSDPIGMIRHLVGPAFSLGIVMAAILVRYIRAEVLEQLNKDYITVARAKGVIERKVLFKHAARNASIPLITIWVLYFARYLGGTIVIEQLFSWPGIGRLAFKAVSGRDYPLLQGLILLFGITYAVANLLSDLLYAIVDPRITYD